MNKKNEWQEIYEWVKGLAFKNCKEDDFTQLYWFFEDIIDNENKIDKAIEYIDKWKFEVAGNGACMEYSDVADLLNILTGLI